MLCTRTTDFVDSRTIFTKFMHLTNAGSLAKMYLAYLLDARPTIKIVNPRHASERDSTVIYPREIRMVR